MKKCVRYTIKGLVQGIGFRPFVAETAEELNIVGTVQNSGGIVTAICKADEEILAIFEKQIRENVPANGYISEIVREEISLEEGFFTDLFSIIESDDDSENNLPFIPADIATCEACEAELFDEKNRRYRHPFISCTSCGPRYSILNKIPYDRETITMDDFKMCPECYNEYTKKGNRRRHAQTIACNHCGPKLCYEVIVNGQLLSATRDNGAVDKAAELLLNGGIVAIKDIGGYHLACDPFNEDAVKRLRMLKHREAKAFAVMFPDLETASEYTLINELEKKLLTGSARPIVLLDKNNSGKKLADNVCLTSPCIGTMLPCNPLQIMLTKKCGPLVMTSGNVSGDTLEINDEKMQAWLLNRSGDEEMRGLSFGILSHDREILRPLDDSVMRVVAGRQLFVRRGRGFVPTPIKTDIKGEILAAGGDLKSSFCYVKNGFAYVSQYLGDLESISCQLSYKKELEAMKKIFGFRPVLEVGDMHPGYFSNKIVEGQTSVQHHMAHVASVIAEDKIEGEVLGFAFDGTGYGLDGTVWGGEVFKWDTKRMERVAHLKPVKLLGGDEGAKNCKTIFEGYVYSLGLGAEDTMTAKAINLGINTITSSSMGRLFDAVSYLLGICDYNTYEGQAAIELENVASTTEEFFPLIIGEDGDTRELFAGLLLAIGSNVPIPQIARGFIYAIADYIVEVALEYKIHDVVLSGGTFLNKILTAKAINELMDLGFEVHIASQLPPTDGGLCLGQAYLAAKEAE